MSVYQAMGPGNIPTAGIPQLWGRSSGSGTSRSLNFANAFTNVYCVVTHVDMTCTGAEPVQCFAHFADDFGNIIYWDSQSTGEGNGVTFVWRGLYVVNSGQSVTAYLTAASTITMGLAINGYFLPPGPSSF